MPFCPNCRYEYSKDIDECPDCGAALVDKLHDDRPDGADDDVRSVLLLKTDDYLKAQLVAGALEESGIRYWAKRLGLSGRLGTAVTGAIMHDVLDAPKPAEIYVLPDNLAEAQEIMRSFEEDFSGEENLEEEEE